MRPNQVKFSVMLADINSTFSFFNKSTNFFKNNLKFKKIFFNNLPNTL